MVSLKLQAVCSGTSGLLQKVFFCHFRPFAFWRIYLSIRHPRNKEMLFQAAGGTPAVYAAKAFEHIMTEQHIYEWSELVSYGGGP